MRWHHLAVAIVAASALVGTGAVLLFPRSDSGPVADSSPTPSEPPLEAWRLSACPAELVRVLERPALGRKGVCATLRVPQSESAKGTLTVGVTRLLPKEPSTRAPVLLLAGGPGDSFFPRLESRLSFLLPFAAKRELLIIDQRGTGAGSPKLDCDSKLRKKEDLKRCFDQWSKDLDVASFTTENSARDIKAVLDQLALDQVSIIGVSYGTKLASTFAEMYPNHVEALILDSPMPRSTDVLSSVGVHAKASLRAVLDGCAEQADCNKAFPFVKDDLGDIARAIDAGNAGNANNPSGARFLAGVVKLAISPAVLPLIPYLVSQAREGDFQLYERLRNGFSEYEFAFGVHLSVQCAEVFPLAGALDAGAQSGEESPLDGELGPGPYDEYCDAWSVPRGSATPKEAAPTSPTLVLHGKYDPVVPLEYAELVAGAAPNSRLVQIPLVSHGAAFTGCGVLVVQQFLEAFAVTDPPPLPSCVEQSQGLQFALYEPKNAAVSQALHQIRFRL